MYGIGKQKFGNYKFLRRVFCLEPVQKQPKYDSQYGNDFSMNWKLTHTKFTEPSGLVNLGNSCFVNAIVQAIFAVPLFQDKFLHGVHTNEYSFSNELQSLFVQEKIQLLTPHSLLKWYQICLLIPFILGTPQKFPKEPKRMLMNFSVNWKYWKRTFFDQESFI